MNKVIVIGAISSYAVNKFQSAIEALNKESLFVFNENHLPDNHLDENQIIKVKSLDMDSVDLLTHQLNQIEADIYSIVPGGELAVPMVEALCKRFGFAHNEGDILRFRNKHAMRKSLAKGAIHQPEVYGEVADQNELQHLIPKLKFPLIIKPVDCAASFFVKKAFNQQQLLEVLPKIKQHTHSQATGVKFSGHALLEQYIAGIEYSAEVLVDQHACQQYFITRKILSDEPFFDEIGHVSLLREDEPKDAYSFINAIIDTMDIDNGVLHIEFRETAAGELFLIEMATRIAGDLISNIVELTHHVSLETFYILVRSHDQLRPSFIDQNTGLYTGIKFLFNSISAVDDDITIIEDNVAQHYQQIENVSQFNILNRRGYQIFQTKSLPSAINYIREHNED